MNDQLAKLGDQSNEMAPKDFFDEQTKRGDYLSPLNLCQKMSKHDDNLGWKAGDFLFNQKDILGKVVNIVPLAYRPHAMIIENEKVKFQTFKPGEEYSDIKSKCDAKPRVEGYLAGIDFLVWIPAKQEFAVMFLYRTGLKEAGQDLRANIGKVITFTATSVEWKNYSWFVPKVTNCVAEGLTMPTDEQLEVANNMFKDIDKAADAPTNEGERPR